MLMVVMMMMMMTMTMMIVMTPRSRFMHKRTSSSLLLLLLHWRAAAAAALHSRCRGLLKLAEDKSWHVSRDFFLKSALQVTTKPQAPNPKPQIPILKTSILKP